MKNTHFLKAIVTITITFSSFQSCKWGSEQLDPRGKNIICVVDFSDSKNSEERLQFYMNVIKTNIIPNLGLYDKISVLPIDKASITNSSDIFLNDLSSKDFEPEMASPMEVDEITLDNLKAYKDTMALEFIKKFQQAIDSRSKSNHGTDIFGALQMVKGKLRPNDDNFVIMLSDMMNWSNTLNMEPDNKDFNYVNIDRILTTVPNYEMPNTTVLVLTAEQVEVSPEQFKLVQDFWTRYFENNKMILYDYNSASVSKLDMLMALPVAEQ